MIFASSHVLGIAVTDRAIAVAEISGKGSDRMVRRAATFALPAELSFDDSKTLGQVLGRFLKEKGFSASRALVGVPAKWLIAVEKEVPPAGKEQIKAMLRLQAERLPLAESGDVVFEYAGQHPTGAPGKVLLLAMLQRQLEKVLAAMEEAGISVIAVTATSLALANAAVEAAKLDHSQPMVLLGRHGAEVVWQRQGTPRMLKHFSVATSNGHGAPAMGPLGTELRRAVAVGSGLSTNGQSFGGTAEVVLWDAVGLDKSQIGELSEKVGMKVQSGDGLAMLGVKTLVRSSPGSSDENAPQRYAAPVALAIVGANPSLLPFDFIKSRLAPPKVRRFGRKAVWSATAGALAILAIGWLIVDVQIEQKTLDRLKAERLAIGPQFKEADAVRNRVDFSNRYYKERTPVMDAMRELTMTFRDNDPIWATNLILKEDREGRDLDRLDGTMEGKTADYNVPWVIVNRLRDNPKFSNVTARGVNPVTAGGRGQREVLYSYTIVFTFNPNVIAPSTAPSAQ